MPESIIVAFEADELAAIDAFIARAPDPKPDRSEAVRQLVRGRLAVDGPSTILPDMVTGRDIV